MYTVGEADGSVEICAILVRGIPLDPLKSH